MIRTQTKARFGAYRGAVSLAANTARRLDARIEQLALDLLGKPASRRQRTWRWGRHESLVVNIAGERRGRWFSFEENRGGDALDLVAWVKAVDRAALNWSRAWLGGGR